MPRQDAGARGVALVAVLLALTLLSAVGLGLSLTSRVDRQAGANYEERLVLLNAAESALELAARDLARLDGWDAVLQGAQASTHVDGPPGPRQLDGGTVIDLQAATSLLTCGRSTACTDADARAITAERPWGANNPRWQLFVHRWLPPPAPLPRPARDVYVVVWVGDDAGELDGDPAADGAGPGHEGRYIVRARAEAFGSDGGRQAIAAELARICTTPAGDEPCLPGIRVQSWHLASALP